MGSKLFNLKEWLTVADAARHLSIVFGEEVTRADVLRLGLDGHLRLSAHFVNYTKARSGIIVPWEETEWALFPKFSESQYDRKKLYGLDVRPWPMQLEALFKELPPDKHEKFDPVLCSLEIDKERYLTLSDEVVTLQGVWDLPMIGNERLDIEHEYQNWTGGPEVTLQGLDGAFVEDINGQLFQLQDSLGGDDLKPPSGANPEKPQQENSTNDNEGLEAEQQQEQSKEHPEKQKTRLIKKSYYPAGGLPEDAVIVVRTKALREFEGRNSDTPSPTSHTNVSDKLARMNQAAAKFWANADRNDRGTHPDNATVAAWLVKQGFSATLAEKAATIIRPEWAPTGRKPEE